MTVLEARDSLRKLQSGFSRKGARMHVQAVEDNANKIRALEGLCGICRFVRIGQLHQDGKILVTLGCQKGYSPLELYRRTDLGQEPQCDGYVDR